MKNIRNFQQYTAVYEAAEPNLIGSLIHLSSPLVLYGLWRGYQEVERFFDKVDFKIAKSKIGQLFDKIKDDHIIQVLLTKIQEYRRELLFGEREGDASEREVEAFRIRNEIYKRAKELMSEKDFKKFIDACNEFEDGVGKPGGYFINKDMEYTRYRKFGHKPDRIRLRD